VDSPQMLDIVALVLQIRAARVDLEWECDTSKVLGSPGQDAHQDNWAPDHQFWAWNSCTLLALWPLEPSHCESRFDSQENENTDSCSAYLADGGHSAVQGN